MKWIKNRERFLNEAKIRDVIHPKQAKRVAEKWGEKYLDYEEVDPTDKIKQGKWKLSEEDKNKVLSHFFGRFAGPIDIDKIFKTFEDLSDNFVKSLEESLYIENLEEKYSIIFKNFNARKPTIDQLTCLYESVFRKLSVNDTKSTSMLQKDENGRPISDEEGNMLRVEKEAGAPIFEKNLVNIKGFTQAYNKCYDEQVNYDDDFYNNDISNLISLSKENHNSSYKVDFKIFDRDLYLHINHSAKDILNISISRFYSSCQHLYTAQGSYGEQILSNIFDPNSIPAFLIFDTPIFWDDDKISDFLPLTRMMVRNIESLDDSESKLFFDRAYPDRMKEIFDEVLEKYSDNKSTHDGRGNYVFTPDIDPSDNLRDPYMDRLGLTKKPFIGKNTKSLYLNRNYDWSEIKISPNANIKEMVIETEELPENISDIKLNPEWIKFKFMHITSLEPFNKIKTNSLAFDKCKFNPAVLNDISDEIKKLQIISCDLKDSMDLTKFEKLEELHLIFTLDGIEDLKKSLNGLNIKKLVVSGDLFSSPEDKEYLKSLKREIKVEIVGPLV